MSQKSLLCMCVYDTEENNRHQYTLATCKGLEKVADNGQPMLVVDNASYKPTQEFLEEWCLQWHHVTYLRMETNLGTAGGLNEGIKRLKPGQHLLKIDNDVIVNTPGWIEQLEFVVERMPDIGILGCKRKDCIEYPGHPNPNFNSEFGLVSHKPGEPWRIVEYAKHIMGTCVLYSDKLIDTLGGFYQFGVYGFEDSLYCTRSLVAGFKNAFLPAIDIDHIDVGGPYQKEKEAMANEWFAKYVEHARAIINKEKPVYSPVEIHIV